MNINKTIQPYQFEPENDENDEDWNNDNDANVDNNLELITEGRSGNRLWCQCGECCEMDSDEQSVCCAEFENIKICMQHYTCVSKNPSFPKLILDMEVLNVSRQILGTKTKSKWKQKMLHADNPLNKTWRYVAYRQFVSWINAWKPIGYKNRVVIPSCVVKNIRQIFPEGDEKYVGFKNYVNAKFPA
jgi:hypothetical protein